MKKSLPNAARNFTPDDLARIYRYVAVRLNDLATGKAAPDDVQGVRLLLAMLPDDEERREKYAALNELPDSDKVDSTSGLFGAWLLEATQKLCDEAQKRIAQEISEHFLTSVEMHRAHGHTRAQAEQLALDELGSASAANRRFQQANLTDFDVGFLQFHVEGAFAERFRKLGFVTFGFHLSLTVALIALNVFSIWLALERPEQQVNLWTVCLALLIGGESMKTVLARVLRRIFRPKTSSKKCLLYGGLQAFHIMLLFASISLWPLLNADRYTADRYDFLLDLLAVVTVTFSIFFSLYLLKLAFYARHKLSAGPHAA